MAARKIRGTKENPMSEDWKSKIRGSQIVNRLQGCLDGDIDLNSNQIKCATIILNKIEPDVSRVESQQLDKDGNKTDPVQQMLDLVHKSNNNGLPNKSE